MKTHPSFRRGKNGTRCNPFKERDISVQIPAWGTPEASLIQLIPTLISALVTRETNIKLTCFNKALTDNPNGNRFIVNPPLLWSCRSMRHRCAAIYPAQEGLFSQGFKIFQHILLSIKKNLVCAEQIARKSSLCVKSLS